MKIKITIATFLLIGLASCKDDFLDLSPQNFISSATFYKTEDDFVQAINGTYAPLRGLYGDAYAMAEMRSDNTHYIIKTNDRGGQNVQREQIADFLEDPSNSYTNNKWSNAYVIIARANRVLSQIDDVVFSEASKNNIKGQALFLRAFVYYDLVQYFGRIPLHLRPSTGQADASLPKSAVADVYSQIIIDAKEAARLLPNKAQQENGRATSGAAKTLLGYVHLTLKQYGDAETVLKEVVSSGQYGLLADYASVFALNNKNSSESVFEIQYLQGSQGLQSNFIYAFIPGLLNTQPITGVVGNNQSTGGWNTPTDDLINAYETGDARKDASIGFYTDAGVTYPYIKKYLHPHVNFNNTDDNWPVYRYADVLLLLAEALNEQNKSTEAITYLNNSFGSASIRGRANLIPVVGLNQSAVRTIIEKERRVELAFENHRWLDLVRTDRAIAVMNAYGAQVKANPEKYYYPIGNVPLPQSYNVTESRLLFPIPDRQVVLNPLLK